MSAENLNSGPEDHRVQGLEVGGWGSGSVVRKDREAQDRGEDRKRAEAVNGDESVTFTSAKF